MGVGTVPHALIAAYGGDTVAAARAFAGRYAGQMNVTVLVDFDNDSVATAVAVADALGGDLWGVRLDTSERLVDAGLERAMGDAAPPGVNVPLARAVRAALDDAGHGRVRIVASGGFDAERIRLFEAEGAPVDAYGVGSSLLRGQNDFTADVVLRRRGAGGEGRAGVPAKRAAGTRELMDGAPAVLAQVAAL